MPYKLCPNCSRASYSASDRGVWNCPYCGKDITFVPSTADQPGAHHRKRKTFIKHLRVVR